MSSERHICQTFCATSIAKNRLTAEEILVNKLHKGLGLARFSALFPWSLFCILPKKKRINKMYL